MLSSSPGLSRRSRFRGAAVPALSRWPGLSPAMTMVSADTAYTDGMNFSAGNQVPSSVGGQGIAMNRSKAM